MDGIPALADDFRDLLSAFIDHEVRFLVVGGHALAVHGHPRATGDLDVWVETSEANAERTHGALRAFGAPLRDLTIEDLGTAGTVFQIGPPPLRIDVLTELTGIEFESVWPDRLEATVSGIQIPLIGRQALIANKRAARSRSGGRRTTRTRLTRAAARASATRASACSRAPIPRSRWSPSGRTNPSRFMVARARTP